VLAGCAGLPAAAPDPKPAVTRADRWQATLPHAGALAELSRWWAQVDDPLLEPRRRPSADGEPERSPARPPAIEQARAIRTAAGAALLPALDAAGRHRRRRGEAGLAIAAPRSTSTTSARQQHTSDPRGREPRESVPTL
jgi:outer membrane protein TolC